MQDKSAGARQVAQECLSVLIAAGTVQPARVRAGTRDFAPAVMRQLKPALEKILESPGRIHTRVGISHAPPLMAMCSQLGNLLVLGKFDVDLQLLSRQSLCRSTPLGLCVLGSS